MQEKRDQTYISLAMGAIIVSLLLLLILPEYKPKRQVSEPQETSSETAGDSILVEKADTAVVEKVDVAAVEVEAEVSDSVVAAVDEQAVEGEQATTEDQGVDIDKLGPSKNQERVTGPPKLAIPANVKTYTGPWTLDTVATEGNRVQKAASGEKARVRRIDLDGTSEIVAIEDFGRGGREMDKFRRAVAEVGVDEPLRIAVMGDSFIENDIITADLRENFQGAMGGNGGGFMAFASPVSKYRSTIKHTFSGWDIHSIMRLSRVPEKYQDKFFISGFVCIPSEGAKVSMEMTSFRKYLRPATVARLLFINEKDTKMKLTINGDQERVFAPRSSPQVQELVIRGSIEKLEMVLSSVDGFIGYGVLFEGDGGVSVDNYSVRGISGTPMIRTDQAVNGQVDRILDYDLIILQYGLNVMQAEKMNYDSFSASLTRLIRHIKSGYPNASIMLMGVGDRGQRKNGQYSTMQAVHGVIEAQRKAAEEEGVAFWDTFEAMGGENSMTEFVARGWAAKDHLHMGYNGGRYLASQMYRSLMDFYVPSHVRPRETKANAQLDWGDYDTIEAAKIVPIERAIKAESVAADTIKVVAVDSTAVARPDTISVEVEPETIETKTEN